ncbi:MAG TPA: hypothetical protein VLD61_02055 [Methylomirabilota bacterium]|nr:hypothetical protein [Methylomirabilota bacterium]
MPTRRLRAVLLGILLAIGVGGGVAAQPGPEDEEEVQAREAYLPLPEFRSQPDRTHLVVDAITFIRAKRRDQSEALVAREPSGWEHVILDGWQLTFYSPGRAPLRPVAGRHLIVQDWSGGAHCCFDYHVLHVQGAHIRREGLIRAGDCSLRVADLDGDGALELIACDARFAYAFDLSFVEAPLVPLVYAFRERTYQADNRRYPQVFRYRIAQERRRLAEAEQTGDARAARRAVISLLLHMLYAGRVTEGWCTFEQSYRWADRARVRQEVLARLRRTPDPEDARLPIADVAYTLAPPERCK